MRFKNEEGVWVDWETGLAEVMIDYYNILFTASQTQHIIVLDCITREITDEQNERLLAMVEAYKVRKAVFQMHPDKSPVRTNLILVSIRNNGM